jgi:hypothetical protein
MEAVSFPYTNITRDKFLTQMHTLVSKAHNVLEK